MTASVRRSISAPNSAGCCRASRRAARNSLLPPPSTMYAASVQGAPAKPISVTSGGSADRSRRSVA